MYVALPLALINVHITFTSRKFMALCSIVSALSNASLNNRFVSATDEHRNE